MHLSSKDTRLQYNTQGNLSILKLFKCESNHNRSGRNIKYHFLKIINYVRILMFKKGLRNNRSANNEAKPHLTVRMRLRKRGYLPIQKLEKIRPSRSSEVNSPVISLKFCCARRNSSASSSPAHAPISCALPWSRWRAASSSACR